MRLFRQKRLGDWDEVFIRIADAVRNQRPTSSTARQGEALGPSAEALRKKGAELCRQGRFGDAIGILRRALLKQAESPPTYNNLGVALAHEGQLAEAVNAYMQALRLRPHYPEALHNLGEALQKQGKLNEAIRYYGERYA